MGNFIHKEYQLGKLENEQLTKRSAKNWAAPEPPLVSTSVNQNSAGKVSPHVLASQTLSSLFSNKYYKNYFQLFAQNW